MNYMKCPFCGELLKDGIAQISGLELFRCPKCFKFANESTWQELILTRKALSVAVDGLDFLATAGRERRATEFAMAWRAQQCLDQIKTITKKD